MCTTWNHGCSFPTLHTHTLVLVPILSYFSLLKCFPWALMGQALQCLLYTLAFALVWSFFNPAHCVKLSNTFWNVSCPTWSFNTVLTLIINWPLPVPVVTGLFCVVLVLPLIPVLSNQLFERSVTLPCVTLWRPLSSSHIGPLLPSPFLLPLHLFWPSFSVFIIVWPSWHLLCTSLKFSPNKSLSYPIAFGHLFPAWSR